MITTLPVKMNYKNKNMFDGSHVYNSFIIYKTRNFIIFTLETFVQLSTENKTMILTTDVCFSN